MDILFPQILFQLINFSVVVGALSYLLYKPVLKILEERANRIEEAQKAARETLAEKERISEIEKEIVKKAEKKAAAILDKARKSAQEAEALALEKAKDKAAAEIEKSRTEWEAERKKYMQDMKSAFTASVITAAGKVIDVELDAKKHSKLIDEQLETLLKKI